MVVDSSNWTAHMPNSRLASIARFGPFELNCATGELYEAARRTVLPEQQFRILEMLVVADGNLVTREEIRKRLWPDDTVVEFDRSINAAIKKLRATLGDSADEPRFIETVARRGYRLMVHVDYAESTPNVKVTSPPTAGNGLPPSGPNIAEPRSAADAVPAARRATRMGLLAGTVLVSFPRGQSKSNS
jgi:DNA-binding winged helix-turn-helix (wHTH) protein